MAEGWRRGEEKGWEKIKMYSSIKNKQKKKEKKYLKLQYFTGDMHIYVSWYHDPT